jgi:hypothetical protein
MSKAQLRASQLLTTFGPGAMLDLPEGSVVVSGLDHWRFQKGPLPMIDEPRLLAKLRARLARPSLTLRRPPASEDDPQAGLPGVVVWRFPRWFIVQQTETLAVGTRRRLVPQSRLQSGKYRDGNESFEVVPVRFVRACEHGHVDDIDWPAFVHGYAGGCGGDLFLEERSTTGELADIWVTCSCKARRSLAQAAARGSKALGRCDGARPWLGAYSQEACDRQSRLLIRSASNAYFPQLLSVISIPDQKSPVDDIVRSLWEAGLQIVDGPEKLAVLRQVPALATRLAGLTDAVVLQSIDRVRQGVGQMVERPVKDVEFEAFAEAKDELGSDTPDGDFFARALPGSQWTAPWTQAIRRVVLVHRLREVVAQVAFTRFESLGADINGELPAELDLAVKPASITREQDWLPAVENRGEGVFLLFDGHAIHAWAKRPEVVQRLQHLDGGFAAWKATHPQSARLFPGGPYYLLHTFSHLLMTAIALDCGYPASSIRERIYALRDSVTDPGRFGILLYTGSSDAEGTLGGLVEAARRIRMFIRHALEMAMLCSNDPVCAHHAPGQHDHAPLLGAACHGCILVPETSCEQRNEFLDRALVVPTVERAGAEFFKVP